MATVEETMEVKSRNGEPLTKQEIIIRDATGSCTVILYEQYVELMEAGKSYKMETLRFRKNYDHYYLNTSEKKIATFTPIDDLQDLYEMAVSSNATLNGQIVGISKINATYNCCLCHHNRGISTL